MPYNLLKRIIDITLFLIIITICMPFIGIILLGVFLLTGENPILIQKRKISLEKKCIRILKIRTIKSTRQFRKLEKDSNLIFVKQDYEIYVPLFCKWLRKTGIDEILQVINVLKGEMSFVGPRPLLESDLIIMKEHEPFYYNKRKVIYSKPGITGFWQIYGERPKGIQNLIELDEIYERQKSILLDIKILSRTLFVMITASHSDSIITNKEKIRLSGKKSAATLQI